jgi:hypothetical protein
MCMQVCVCVFCIGPIWLSLSDHSDHIAPFPFRERTQKPHSGRVNRVRGSITDYVAYTLSDWPGRSVEWAARAAGRRRRRRMAMTSTNEGR